MRLSRDIRWIDVALPAAALLVVLAIGYLAYTVLSTESREEETAAASRTVADLTAAIEEAPNDPAPRLKLAEVYAAAGRLDEAVEQYEVVLGIDEDNAAALTGLGLIAMFEDDWESAEEYWRRLIDEIGTEQYAGLDQRLAVAYHQLGVTLIEREKYGEAVRYLKEALRIRRTAADTHYALAVAYRELGSKEKQRTHLHRALMFDPLMPEANYDFGLLLLAEGDVAGAAEHFRDSADNAPEGITDPADELAELGPFEERLAEARRLAQSDPAAALVEARVARALDPGDLAAAKLVARLYRRTGDAVAAEEAWQKVLVLWPDEPEAVAALKRLQGED
ncbi:MAG TPA: tetratricopeptide repeat protein [Coriobacteriia bacterium]|nr:tetratricopeptide repeat protein [Coriobacteriia bacterium]